MKSNTGYSIQYPVFNRCTSIDCGQLYRYTHVSRTPHA